MMRPPIRRGRAAVLTVALVAVLSLAGAPAAAQASLDVVATGVADGRARLIVGTDDGPTGPPSVSVWVAGVAQPTRIDALLSERLAMALVVDTSTDAAAVLAAGATGAANLVLAAPPAARGTLVVGSAPPVVAAPWPSGREAMVAGLSAVQPGGTPATAAALDLALAQLPAVATDPRIVVLFTAAPDAGGEPAAAVVDRMRAAGAVLAVVETGGAGSADFWSTTAAGTGGVAVRAASTDVVAAFDRVTQALQQRCLVTIPAPERLPATAVVRTGGHGAPLTAEAVVPAPPPAVGGPALLAVLAGVAVLVVAALRRRARAPVGRRATPIWNVPPRPEPFVERRTLSAQVTEALRGNRPVWLHAAGAAAGVGTTTAAIDFAHRHRARYDIAWWVPALDPDLVPDYLAELAEQAGLAGPDDAADRAAASLTEALRHRPRWLLVFDDAGSPRELAPYLPDGPGDVLVTSGHPGWRDAARSLPVPALTAAEAVALLRSGRRDLQAAEAERLARACGCLPVALGPTAAWLADTGMDAPTGLPDPTPGTADGMWNLLLDRLQAEHPKAFALLALVAWMGQAPVPLTVVTGHPDLLPAPLDGSVAEQAELLHRRGMVQLTEAGVLLHGTPAELVRCRTQADHRPRGGWAAVVVRLLRAAAPPGSPSDPTTRSAWRRVLPHVVAATDPTRPLDAVVEDVSWLLDQAGRYLAACGRTRAAEALLNDAQVLGASHSGPVTNCTLTYNDVHGAAERE